MKKMLMLISLAAILLMGTNPLPGQLISLTVVNKSSSKLAVQLTGVSNTCCFYYLQVPKGTTERPAMQTFTIATGKYKIEGFYLQLWDPVYGYKCGDPGTTKMSAFRDMRLIFTRCNYKAPNMGEPSMMKFGNWHNQPLR
jgi:hypothetical protein